MEGMAAFSLVLLPLKIDLAGYATDSSCQSLLTDV